MTIVAKATRLHSIKVQYSLVSSLSSLSGVLFFLPLLFSSVNVAGVPPNLGFFLFRAFFFGRLGVGSDLSCLPELS